MEPRARYKPVKTFQEDVPLFKLKARAQISPGNAHDFPIYARPIYIKRFRTGFGL